jgi:hypothetical protein
MSLWMEHLNELARYDALLCEAERERNARQARRGRRKHMEGNATTRQRMEIHLTRLAGMTRHRPGNDMAGVDALRH